MSDAEEIWYYFEATEDRGPILIHESEYEYACGIADDLNLKWKEVRVTNITSVTIEVHAEDE